MKYAVFLLSVFAFPAIAQQSTTVSENDSAKMFPLREVVVSATKTEKLSSEIGRSVSVVTNAQAKNFLYQNVGELLTQQAGIYIVGAGQNLGMVQSIFTRGSGSNQTAIMVDDIRITDPSAVNNGLDLSELAFTGVERVEIVRGSHSTLYGSSAVGGVLNFITQRGRTEGFNLDADVTTGTFGEKTSVLSENIFLNYTNPVGFYFNTGITNTGVQGIDATVDTVTSPAKFNNRDKDGSDKTDLFGKIGYRDDNSHFYFSYKNNFQRKDLDKGAFVDDDNYTLNFKRNLFTYGASYQFDEGFGMKYIGGYSAMERNTIDDSSVVDQAGSFDHTYSDATYHGTMTTHELQGSVHIGGIDGIVGIGSYEETMGTRTHTYISSFAYDLKTNLDTMGLKSTTRSLFAHVDLNGSSVRDDLRFFSIATGMRFNFNSTFNDHITYEINPSIKVTDRSLLYFSYSTGFNAPSLYRMFTPEAHYLSGITRGNKNLEPETSFSYEIGFKQAVDDNIDFLISYFGTTVENNVEYVYLWDKNIGVDTLGNDFLRDDSRGDTYLNIGRQTTSGIELSIDSKINEQIYLSGNISFVSGKLTYNPADIDTSQTGGNHVQINSNGAFITKQVETLGLTRRPNTANVNLTYKPNASVALRVDLKIVGSRGDVYYDSNLGPYGALGTVLVGDYTVLDVSSKFSFDENFSVSGRVENVFDTKYSEIKGFTTRGRGFYISMRYEM